MKGEFYIDILVYDGQCNMCSNFIRFIIKINKNKKLKITSFDSDWTKQNIISDIDSMIFLKDDRVYLYSDAVINIVVSANKFFYPLLLLKIVPKIIRNTIYKFIAKHRRKIMKVNSCPIHTKEERRMFIY
ncbi:thiol-disulfide oxidoreductase DCC family protein [Psychrobacillus psychrodurans]|uniref:thiol-disulfide oxidoreductase DCC family protein n=1 Tax=Psychrobacillus psychrodurans TaxID=126157 RepID=UPI003A4C5741